MREYRAGAIVLLTLVCTTAAGANTPLNVSFRQLGLDDAVTGEAYPVAVLSRSLASSGRFVAAKCERMASV